MWDRTWEAALFLLPISALPSPGSSMPHFLICKMGRTLYISAYCGVMEPAASCLLGFLVAFLLLQFTIPTQDVLFKPAYMSLMSKRPPRPVIYLIIIFILHCLRCFCCLIWKKYKCIKDSKGLRLVYQLVCEGLPLALYIGFLPLYLTFRSQASILDDAYPLYSNWLWDVCIILVVMMIFFTVLILLLLCTLKTKEQNNQDRLSQTSDEAVQEMASFLSLRSFREEIILHQGSCSEESIPHQGSCSEENIQEQGSCIGKIILHQGSCSEESILHQGSCSEESIQEQGSCIEESILHQGSCSEESIVHQGSCSEERILD
ncbi:selection and upkeep of intraepithelial T-cells protein 10-like isoform X3 [Arvicola amphibius]|uniref:selection and upkeep of intraepithelial T-cells protein 10-like isoform X3 n=1 Tax=Arvicola amphibius TaxID=1047088 RepID=UPI0018E3EDF5|nr:selection and upkeep of intraepithelial T-cells protein 10-like isoform X3 [Arvicola amphibius]